MTTHTAARPLGALGRMSLVAGIHAAVLLAIMRSLGIGSGPAAPPDDVIAEFYKEVPPVEDPPPLPDVPLVRNDSVVLPDIPIDKLITASVSPQ